MKQLAFKLSKTARREFWPSVSSCSSDTAAARRGAPIDKNAMFAVSLVAERYGPPSHRHSGRTMKDLTPTKTTSSWEPIAANGIEVWLRAEETRSSDPLRRERGRDGREAVGDRGAR